MEPATCECRNNATALIFPYRIALTRLLASPPASRFQPSKPSCGTGAASHAQAASPGPEAALPPSSWTTRCTCSAATAAWAVCRTSSNSTSVRRPVCLRVRAAARTARESHVAAPCVAAKREWKEIQYTGDSPWQRENNCIVEYNKRLYLFGGARAVVVVVVVGTSSRTPPSSVSMCVRGELCAGYNGTDWLNDLYEYNLGTLGARASLHCTRRRPLTPLTRGFGGGAAAVAQRTRSGGSSRPAVSFQPRGSGPCRWCTRTR